MTINKNLIFLILILIFGSFLRFWNLGSYPALNADEAAIGYNAYSLIETGRDEHGNSWPIHFQSFNDYKPGLYFYLAIPFIKALGLSVLSVRIPGAILGVLTIYLIYLLSNLLIKDKKFEISGIKFGLWSALFLAISPWHLHFSRGAWEVNAATFFITLGLLLFLKSLNRDIVQNVKEKSEQIDIVFLFLSVISFSLSLYTYHAARIIVPFLGFGLLGIYFQEIKTNIRKFLLAGLLFLVTLTPLIKDFTKPEISSRAAGVGLFADSGPLSRINEQRGEHIDFTGLTSKVLHNKPVNYTFAFFENWASHFHGLFLFLSGDDIERNKVPETGQMHMLDFIFIIFGLTWMAKNINPANRLIFHWVIIAPVAAALTFQSPHALRAHNMVVPLVIIAAIGFVNLIQLTKVIVRNKKMLFAGYLIVAFLVSWQFLRYGHMYWYHMSQEYPYSSQYGVKELFDFVSEKEKDYEKFVVTTRYDQPYILFMFYGASQGIEKYHPANFQDKHDLAPRDEFGFSTVTFYENLVFKNIEWELDKVIYGNSLIAGTKEEIIRESNIIKKIYGTNGFEYFNVVAN